MKYGPDMLYPPTVGEAQTMVALGWEYCCAYIGGPRAAAHNAWHQIDGKSYPIRDLQRVFKGFLPIYVGRNTPWDSAVNFWNLGATDGDDCNNNMGACGFASEATVCLDLEYGSYQKYPTAVKAYCHTFVARVKMFNPDREIHLYSDAQSCQALAYLFDGTFMAWWVEEYLNLYNPRAPIGKFDPSEPPASDAWQFGGGVIAGVQVDLDSFRDDYPFAVYGG